MTASEDPEWRNNRERITYEEGRHVLEAQKSDIDDIDDKALRTVRITALLLGVGATGVRVIGTSGINKSVAALSLFSFLLSLTFGVIVYNESNEVIGPKASYLGRLRRNEMSAPWEADLLVQFEGWISANQTIVEFNGYLLIACQLFFVLGVSLGAASLLALKSLEILTLIVGLLFVVTVVLAVIQSRVQND
ncbi:hypothetical protein NGM10_04085 [Halorussus salilacus]|uniref:hypothetical protein n=1 Tax=Halorussus salilacus TaxID=2953750 RepID=UPI0020A0672A|nr:hypothetical protein [Halorussus salilacus]USZ68920.1 hypothetical protein NGM10_04085 [Halorussus salilacus]